MTWCSYLLDDVVSCPLEASQLLLQLFHPLFLKLLFKFLPFILRQILKCDGDDVVGVEITPVLGVGAHCVPLLPQRSRQLCCCEKLIRAAALIPRFRGGKPTVFQCKTAKISQTLELLGLGRNYELGAGKKKT